MRRQSETKKMLCLDAFQSITLQTNHLLLGGNYLSHFKSQALKSEVKHHQEVLSKRLVLWKDDEVEKLLRDERTIQSRIGKLKSSDPPNRSKVFAKLVLILKIMFKLFFLIFFKIIF